jgi:putative sterol carrier protein
MSTEVLRAALDDKRQLLARSFNPQVLQRDDVIFQFIFDHELPFHLVIESSSVDLVAGKCPQPTIQLYIDTHATCWGLLEGEIDGMQAFMTGRYRADGNIVLSQLLLYLFRSNDRAIAYEVQD